MITKEFKNEKEKENILSKIKEKGIKGIIIKEFNGGKGIIKY